MFDHLVVVYFFGATLYNAIDPQDGDATNV